MNTNHDQEPINPTHELHRFWWLVLPISFFLFRYAVHLATNHQRGLESYFRGELGLIENLTVLILVGAIVTTLLILIRFGDRLHLATRIALLIYTLGCFYFGGEEASWGQHWFGWESSEFFNKYNDQQETNIHNTSVWLDRVPKALLSLMIFVGGIVIPLYLRRAKTGYDSMRRGWWMLPTMVCLPTAVIATMTTWPAKIERMTDLSFYFYQAQETKELYMAYFLLLFILSLGLRLRRLVRNNESFSPL